MTLRGHATQRSIKTRWLWSSVTYYRASCLSPASEHIRRSGLHALHSTRHLNGSSQVSSPNTLCQAVTLLKPFGPWTPPLQPPQREAAPGSRNLLLLNKCLAFPKQQKQKFPLFFIFLPLLQGWTPGPNVVFNRRVMGYNSVKDITLNSLLIRGLTETLSISQCCSITGFVSIWDF